MEMCTFSDLTLSYMSLNLAQDFEKVNEIRTFYVHKYLSEKVHIMVLSVCYEFIAVK